jgi:hypothetical protein
MELLHSHVAERLCISTVKPLHGLSLLLVEPIDQKILCY